MMDDRAGSAFAVVFICCAGSALLTFAVYASGLHGGSLRSLGLPLAFAAWAGVCGLVLLMRASWARKLFLAWAVTSGLAACGYAMAGDIPWSGAGLIVCGLALATLIVFDDKQSAS